MLPDPDPRPLSPTISFLSSSKEWSEKVENGTVAFEIEYRDGETKKAAS
jgi:hypothetical protein